MSELELHGDLIVVHPGTGEMLLVRDAADELLARFLDEVRDYESRLREAKGIVNCEVLRRLDLDGQWTKHIEGWQLSAPSPAPGEEFNGEALYRDLVDLAYQDHISPEAVERAVKAEMVYKVQAAGVKALRKLGGIVKETVDRHATEVEKRRYVKVERT